MSISDIGPMLRTCMFTSIRRDGPGHREQFVLHKVWTEHCTELCLDKVTSKVWSETVVVVLEEAVQKLGHVVGRLVGEDDVGHLRDLVRLVRVATGAGLEEN